MQYTTFALLAASLSYVSAATINLSNPPSVTAAAALPEKRANGPDGDDGDDGDDSDDGGIAHIGNLSLTGNGNVVNIDGDKTVINGVTVGGSGSSNAGSDNDQTIEVLNSVTISNGVTLGASAAATPTGSGASKPGGPAQTGTSAGAGAAAVMTSATTHNAAPTRAALSWELMGAVIVGVGAAAM